MRFQANLSAHLLPVGRQVCSDYGLHDSDACNLLT
jgi:hypothetical protein